MKDLFSTDDYGRRIINRSVIDPAKRFCFSPNLYNFFRNPENRHYTHVIRWNRRLYLVDFWGGERNGQREWAGGPLRAVAGRPGKVIMGWHTDQFDTPHEDVTAWFWDAYLKEGMYGVFEIWHKSHPRPKTHRECSQV